MDLLHDSVHVGMEIATPCVATQQFAEGDTGIGAEIVEIASRQNRPVKWFTHVLVHFR